MLPKQLAQSRYSGGVGIRTARKFGDARSVIRVRPRSTRLLRESAVLPLMRSPAWLGKGDAAALVTEARNVALAGTSVVSGSATLLVCQTARETTLGKLARQHAFSFAAVLAAQGPLGQQF